MKGEAERVQAAIIIQRSWGQYWPRRKHRSARVIQKGFRAYSSRLQKRAARCPSDTVSTAPASPTHDAGCSGALQAAETLGEAITAADDTQITVWRLEDCEASHLALLVSLTGQGASLQALEPGVSGSISSFAMESPARAAGGQGGSSTASDGQQAWSADLPGMVLQGGGHKENPV